MKPNKILHKIIPLFLLISAGIFNARLFAYSPGDLSNSGYCRKASPERQASDSTKFRSTSIPAEYYDNSERTSTFKTDSVLVTASLPYKVCKDSTLTISLKLKNLSRQPIYCVPDMEELISFGEDPLTSKHVICIDYTFNNYDEVEKMVKIIKIEPDSTFTSYLSMKLNEIGKFNPKDYFYSDINFGYIPSYALLKKGKIKPGLNENYIMLSINYIIYYTVEVNIGTFRSEVEACP